MNEIDKILQEFDDGDFRLDNAVAHKRTRDWLKDQLIKYGQASQFKILNDFMGFMRNGHNLKEGDLDRIEAEFALFMARNFNEQYYESLTKESSNKENQ